MSQTAPQRLSFSEGPPGSPAQISSTIHILSQAVKQRKMVDKTVRAATSGDVNACFDLSMREDFDFHERREWLWVAASLGHQEAISQMCLLGQFAKVTLAQEPTEQKKRQERIEKATKEWHLLDEKDRMANAGTLEPVDQEVIELLGMIPHKSNLLVLGHRSFADRS